MTSKKFVITAILIFISLAIPLLGVRYLTVSQYQTDGILTGILNDMTLKSLWLFYFIQSLAISLYIVRKL